MKVCSCNNNFRHWDDYVASHHLATSYHRFGWKSVIERSFGHKVDYLGAIDEAGKLRGVLPLVRINSLLFGKNLTSLPFLNYGGLLCDNAEAESLLLEESRRLLMSTGSEFVEFRHIADRNIGLPVKAHKVTMLLPLQNSVEAQWQEFNPKLRNQIRKAEKSGLTVVIGGAELLDGFYKVFCRNMRDLGTPVYSRSFFQEILRSFSACTRIVTVFKEETPVASGLLIWFRETVEIPWASSVRDYKECCPNNLLYWEALRFAIGKGYSIFDFGRSTPHEGTYRFKLQWGANPVQLHWHYLLPKGTPMPQLNTKNPKYDMAIRLWQKLPLVLTNIMGPHIVKHIP